ncbi:MAG: DUF1559 domain-containing protein [Pirellulales bacterium]|nr:DUF1559 domain-containing protein [Pirellulales bacterium]
MFRTHKATICWVLIFTMVVGPSWAVAQTPAAPPATATPQKLDVEYVTPGTALAAVAFPRRVLTAPEAEMMPTEVMTAAGMKQLGIDPMDVEQILLVAEPPTPPMPPSAGLVVRLAKPYSMAAILPVLKEMTTESTLDGKPCRKGINPMLPSYYMPDDRTLVLATGGMLERMVAQKAQPVEGAMSKLLGRMNDSDDALAVLLVEPIRPLAAMAMASAPPLPPGLEGVRDVPQLVNVVGLKLKLTGNPRALLSVRARDEAAAQELERLVDQLLSMAHQAMMADMARKAPADPVEQAAQQYAHRVSKRMLDMVRPVRKGDRLELTFDQTSAIQPAHMATTGVLIALLLPAVQAAREAARRAQSANNMKQIGIAMHIYLEAKKTFPARANFDAEGKPLLSWRVHILPYIEQEALYREFHLDEPWDSPHNKTLIDRMPEIYRNPSSPSPPGQANYLVPVGPGTLFEGDKGSKIREILDGTSNTILVVEADPDRAVIWTKPDDLTYDPASPAAGLGRAHPGGFNAAFADGSVRFLAKDIDPTVLRAFMTRAGKEIVNPGL